MAGTVTHWLNRLQHGDSAAMECLWKYFSPNMIRRVAPQCRNLKVSDEQDIVSIAFYNLTSSMVENKTEGITSRKEFWRLLRIISKRKLQDSYRRENAKRRGGDYRVISIQDVPAGAVPPANERKTTQVDIDEDLLLEMLHQVASEMHRPEFAKIIEYKVKGMTNGEVARTLGLSLRTTQYLIQEIKDTWCKTFKDL